MALPEDIWVRQVSTSFPDATLRLLTGVPKGDRALELGEVRAENARTVASDIRAHPDIFEFDQVYAGDRRVIARYEADEKGLYEFLWESSLPAGESQHVVDRPRTTERVSSREPFVRVQPPVPGELRTASRRLSGGARTRRRPIGVRPDAKPDL
jgi:hypothetical protein